MIYLHIFFTSSKKNSRGHAPANAGLAGSGKCLLYTILLCFVRDCFWYSNPWFLSHTTTILPLSQNSPSIFSQVLENLFFWLCHRMLTFTHCDLKIRINWKLVGSSSFGEHISVQDQNAFENLHQMGINFWKGNFKALWFYEI